MNLSKMLKQAEAMQSKLGDVKNKIAKMEISGQSGGGMVSILVTGNGRAKKITLDPELIDPNEKEMLEDLIVAAFNDAKKKAEDATEKEMSTVAEGLPLPPGMKLPF